MMDDHDKILCERLATTIDHGICKCHERHRIAALEAELAYEKERSANNIMGSALELADERERREAAEAALGEFVDCNNSDPILIGREHGYRWYDVIARATAHFERYKD